MLQKQQITKKALEKFKRLTGGCALTGGQRATVNHAVSFVVEDILDEAERDMERGEILDAPPTTAAQNLEGMGMPDGYPTAAGPEPAVRLDDDDLDMQYGI